MGYELVAHRKKDKDGNPIEFRLSIWEWPPLWEFCCTLLADKLKPQKMAEGFMNIRKGVDIDNDTAFELANRLTFALIDGTAKEWALTHTFNESLVPADSRPDRMITSLRKHLEEHPEDFKNIKEGTVLNIDGFEYKFRDSMSFDEFKERFGREPQSEEASVGGGGIGRNRDEYVFTEEGVARLAMFAVQSGGFTIK